MTKNGNYSRKELLLKCENALSDSKKGPMRFYAEQFLAHEDAVKGEVDLFRTEIVAGFVNKNIKAFESISNIVRKNYRMESHNGDYSKDTYEEKIIAKKMYSICSVDKDFKFPHIGRIIDYETPIMNVRSNRRIDLLSRNDDKSTVYILELKRSDSPESLLRCYLEVFTYKKLVNKEKLFESFDIPKDYELKAAPLVFKNGTQWEQMQEILRKERPELETLINKLHVLNPFYLSVSDDKSFEVTIDWIG